MSNEIGRIFEAIEKGREEQNRNHTEVVQRLTALETKQHAPEDCPRAARVEEKINAHLKTEATEKRDASWKGFAKEGLRLLAAIGAAIGVTSMK